VKHPRFAGGGRPPFRCRAVGARARTVHPPERNGDLRSPAKGGEGTASRNGGNRSDATGWHPLTRTRSPAAPEQPRTGLDERDLLVVPELAGVEERPVADRAALELRCGWRWSTIWIICVLHTGHFTLPAAGAAGAAPGVPTSITSDPSTSRSCSCSRASNQRPRQPVHRSTVHPPNGTCSMTAAHLGQLITRSGSRVCPAMCAMGGIVIARWSPAEPRSFTGEVTRTTSRGCTARTRPAARSSWRA
jgi:hypothetical protein